MITNPTGTLLFSWRTWAELRVYAYQIGQGGVLTAARQRFAADSSGICPENLATDGLGKYLYVTLGTGGPAGMRRLEPTQSAAAARLRQLPVLPFSYPMYQVQGDPRGSTLIGAQRAIRQSLLYMCLTFNRPGPAQVRSRKWLVRLFPPQYSSAQSRGSTQ